MLIMKPERRVSAPTFFKNRPLSITSAVALLGCLEKEPSASNRRLAVLTGLGVTKDDENDGVLPTHLRFLEAMNFIVESEEGSGSRFATTRSGHLVLSRDPYVSNPASIALMALSLSHPRRGAQLFDWSVRGLLCKLRAFESKELGLEVNLLAQREGAKGGYPLDYLDVVMDCFVKPEVFGSVAPWTEISRTGKDRKYEPRLPFELPDSIFWVCAYMMVLVWHDAFPKTFEATRHDFDALVLPLLKGVLGLKGRVEEEFFVKLHREGVVSSTAVTTERLVLECRDVDPVSFLEKAFAGA